MKPSLSNIEIANRAELWPISEVAEKKLGLSVQDLEPFGWFKAKVPLSLINQFSESQHGKLILVTAMTPTTAGEGKTTTSIGLVDGLGSEGESIVQEIEEKYLEKHPAARDPDSYLSTSYQVRKEMEEWERDNPLLQEFDNMVVFTTSVGIAIVFICFLVGVIFLILLFGT